jgi:hypothetical protein
MVHNKTYARPAVSQIETTTIETVLRVGQTPILIENSPGCISMQSPLFNPGFRVGRDSVVRS